MKPVHYLKDWDEIQAIAHPIRMSALERLTEEAMSPLDLAKSLALKPTTLYHHLDALLSVGLIQVVSERQARGCIEKTYQAIAKDFVLDRDVLKSPGLVEGVAALILSALESSLLTAKQSASEGAFDNALAEQSRAIRIPFHATPERLAKINAAIDSIITLCGESQEDAETNTFLTLVFHPTVRTPKATQ